MHENKPLDTMMSEKKIPDERLDFLRCRRATKFQALPSLAIESKHRDGKHAF